MRVRITVCIALLLIAPLVRANLEAQVDTDTISIGETVQLTLRADGTDITGSPDLKPLEGDFDVQSTEHSTDFSSTNGRVEAWTSWTLLLKPKRTGTLTIPSLVVGNDHSQPLQITVRDLDPAVKRTVFFETSYAPKRVYVQAQVVVTRKLFYSRGAQLYGAMPALPDIAGAMVEPLGDAEHSTEFRNGRQYGVVEQRFAVFPEHSGTLTIPAVTVSGSVQLPSSDVFPRRVGVDISSDKLDIDVLPIPAAYPKDAPWLPATRVELLEDWPAAADHTMHVGTPSQRTLIVRVEGNVASAIPPLHTALPNSLKAYPEAPALNEIPNETGLVGTRTESTSLVATAPGPITLPAVSLTWWDTANQKVRTATLDAEVVEATGAPLPQPPANQQPSQAATPTTTSVPPATPSPPAPTNPVTAPAVSFNLWTVLLAIVAVVAIAGWSIAFTRLRRLQLRPASAADSADHREAAAYKTLARRCRGGDPASIRAALDGWLTTHYRTSLADAAARFNADPEARAAVNALNALLYKQTPGAAFDAAALLRCIDAERRRGTGIAGSTEFPPLYPSV